MDDKIILDPAGYMDIISEGKKNSPTLYCIILASDGHNLFEIIGCNELRFNYYRKRDLFVVGLTYSYKNAVELVTSIIMEVYEKTGAFDVHSYFDEQAFL